MAKKQNKETIKFLGKTKTAFKPEFDNLMEKLSIEFKGNCAELNAEETAILRKSYVGISKDKTTAIKWGIARFLKSKGYATPKAKDERECMNLVKMTAEKNFVIGFFNVADIKKA